MVPERQFQHRGAAHLLRLTYLCLNPSCHALEWRRGVAGGRPQSGSRHPLPLPAVPTGRTGTAVYGLSAVDAHGRIADRAVMAALGWEPGRRLEVQAVRAVVTIRAAVA